MSKKQNIKTKKPAVRKPKEKKELVKVENPESDYRNLPALIKGDIAPGQLILAGIKGKADVETMRGLFELAKEMKAIQAKEEYYKALAKFQFECPIIINETDVIDTEKDGQGGRKIKMQNGKPVKRYSYSKINNIIKQIKPFAYNNGFSFMFIHCLEKMETELIENGEIIKYIQDRLKVTIRINHIAGHCEESSFSSPIDKKAFMSDPQKEGSAYSFCARYALKGGFGIITGDHDDDANSLEKEIQKQEYKNEFIEKAKEILNNPVIINLEKTKAVKKNVNRLDEKIKKGQPLTTDDEEWLKNIITKGLVKIDEHNKTAETKKKNIDELDTLANKGFEDLKNVTPKKSVSELFNLEKEKRIKDLSNIGENT